MNKEIKEILDEIIDNKRTDRFGRIMFEISKGKLLYDYITNLEQENEILKELNVCVGCNNNPDYKSRIDKAVKYIETDILSEKIDKVNWDYDECYFSDMPAERIKPLINILGGDD